jgi:hypothetical protein
LEAGTFSNLRFFVATSTTAGGRTLTLALQKNGTDQTSTLTVPSGVTGWFEDVTNNDAVSSAGDVYQYRMVLSAGGTGSLTFRFIQIAFTPTSQSSWYNRLQGGAVLTFSANATGYAALPNDAAATSATESDVQNRAARAMTLQQLSVRALLGMAGTNTIRSRVNGGNGNCAVTIPASTTGVFTDVTNSDALAVGDLYNISLTNSGGSGSDLVYVGAALKGIDGIAFSGYKNGGSTLSAGGTNYTVPWNPGLTVQTAAPTTQAGITAGDASRLGVKVLTNTLTNPAVLSVLKNGVEGALLLPIPAGVTGTFEVVDTSNRVELTFTDTVAYRFVAGAGGTSLTYSYLWAVFQATVRQARIIVRNRDHA